MLDTFTPEEFDELVEANCLDPIDDTWRQAAEICAAVTNAAILANSTEPPRDDQLAKWEQFVPTLKCLREKRTDDTAPITSDWARHRFP